MAISLLDLVVLSAQIATCCDEVDVVVCIVVLLELDGLKLEPSERLWIRQLLDDLVKLVVFSI